ncbi:MAG: hypothetical protein U0350_34240 [Caldilineaceae bacterium]
MISNKQFVRSVRMGSHLLGLLFMLAALLVALIPWDVQPAFAQNQSGITSPATGAAITGDVPIIGTAVIEPFQKYELAYKLEPSGNDAYVYFGGGTNQVVNGQLGTWQASGLPPGSYSLRLRVVKTDGNYAEYFAQNLSINQQPASPTPTATSSTPTETPIPTATFTPAPPPTANVGQVTQPQVESEQATATPAAAPAGGDNNQNSNTNGGPAAAPDLSTSTNISSSAAATVKTTSTSNFNRQLGEKLSLDTLRSRFFTGVRTSAALFFAAFALFAGKRIFTWAWTRYR